jgi:hypothetical protein
MAALRGGHPGPKMKAAESGVPDGRVKPGHDVEGH